MATSSIKIHLEELDILGNLYLLKLGIIQESLFVRDWVAKKVTMSSYLYFRYRYLVNNKDGGPMDFVFDEVFIDADLSEQVIIFFCRKDEKPGFFLYRFEINGGDEE